MKSLFWILTLFALAVGISLAMHVNEGYVLFVLPPYRAEISFNFAILLTVLGFGVFYVLLRALALASSLPRRIRESRARRQREKTAEAFGEGVRLYLAGKQRKAIDTVAKLSGEGAWPALAASLAARAASELGDLEEQRKWQTRAAELDPRVEKPLAVVEADDGAGQEETAEENTAIEENVTIEENAKK
jgi:HemY protein